MPANNPILQDIKDHLSIGRIDRAKQKLAGLEQARVKAIEEREAQIRENKRKKVLGEQGLLRTETATLSGRARLFVVPFIPH